jgi:hypothetical protein
MHLSLDSYDDIGVLLVVDVDLRIRFLCQATSMCFGSTSSTAPSLGTFRPIRLSAEVLQSRKTTLTPTL